MKHGLAAWKLLEKSLLEGNPAMLLYVLESRGSSPGRQGFFLVVNSLGEMEGSIGGGVMEHQFVDRAKDSLDLDLEESVLKRQIHDKAAGPDGSGMICSGEQTILVTRIHEEEADIVGDLIVSLEADEPGLLRLSPKGLEFEPGETSAPDFRFEKNSETNWVYEQVLGCRNDLHIVGAGHCSLAFSQLMSTLDFRLHLYDDRPGLNTLLRNDWVKHKTVLGSYSELGALIPANPRAYVVVMTFGYKTDDLAVRALMGRDFRYFGVLGSERKIEKLFADYAAEGIPLEWLKKIHAPIGLAIHSQTPEEIAVSIAAEIIQVKNRTGA